MRLGLGAAYVVGETRRSWLRLLTTLTLVLLASATVASSQRTPAGSSAVVNEGPSSGTGLPGEGTSGTGQEMIPHARPLGEWQMSDMLLVSTIDGSLQARDRKTGLELWSLPGDRPLVQVSEPVRNGTVVDGSDHQESITWIVEPTGEGVLFYFTETSGLQRLPVTIKQLVMQSPFKIPDDDKVYTGSRHTTLYSINAATGEVLKVYGGDRASMPLSKPECPVFDEDDEDFDLFEPWQDSGTFMVGRTDYQLSIHGENETIWNVSYSAWGPNNMDGDLALQHVVSMDNMYVTALHNSSIIALSTDSTAKPARWVGTAPSVVVSVFDILKPTAAKRNHPADVLVVLPQPRMPLDAVDGDPVDGATFVQTTDDGQWFAMSGQNFPYLVMSAPVCEWCDAKRGGRLSSMESQSAIVGKHTIECATPRHPPPQSENGGRGFLNAPPLGIEGPSTGNQALGGGSSGSLSSPREYGHGGRLLNPAYQTDYNTIDPPVGYPPLPPPPPPPASFVTSVAPFLTRLVENVLTVFVIVFAIIMANRLGYLPQIAEVLESLVVLTTGKNPKAGLAVSSNTKTADAEVANDAKDAEMEQSKEKLVGDVDTPDVDGKTGEDQKPLSDVADSPQEIQPDKDEETSHSDDDSSESESEPAKQAPKDTNDGPKVSIVEPDMQKQKAEVAAGTITPIKKRKRGSRGGRNRKKDAPTGSEQSANSTSEITTVTSTESEDQGVVTAWLKEFPENNFFVSNDQIGIGSQGTTVFRGVFENREVAVKRMLLSHYDVASQEISLLQESDDHPNVIRYYCNKTDPQFLFIALELCSGTLEDIIKRPADFMDLRGNLLSSHILYQIASGLNHLHSLKIVHRDIKPQNILVAPPKKLYLKNGAKHPPMRILISDFGLCKKLEGDQSTFRPTTAQPGTLGWTAPELSHYQSENSMDGEANGVEQMLANPRLTRAVDIFSLGCVFYYVLSNGQHPFSQTEDDVIDESSGAGSTKISTYQVQNNIDRGKFRLAALENLGQPNAPEARDLISRMIAFDSKDRPDIGTVLIHPLFWSYAKRLDFLLKVSDRFEADTREEHSPMLELFEKNAPKVVGGNWHERLDSEFLAELNKYRKYRPERLIDLLRAMRNKGHHFGDLPPGLQDKMGPYPDNFLLYFTARFPHLLTSVYYFVKEHLSGEPAFVPFFAFDSQHI